MQVLVANTNFHLYDAQVECLTASDCLAALEHHLPIIRDAVSLLKKLKTEKEWAALIQEALDTLRQIIKSRHLDDALVVFDSISQKGK